MAKIFSKVFSERPVVQRNKESGKMLKRFILKLAINNVIKQLPKYKLSAREIVENNIDGILDRIEEDIKALLLNAVAKRENK